MEQRHIAYRVTVDARTRVLYLYSIDSAIDDLHTGRVYSNSGFLCTQANLESVYVVLKL